MENRPNFLCRGKIGIYGYLACVSRLPLTILISKNEGIASEERPTFQLLNGGNQHMSHMYPVRHTTS